jgi:hypothetical protein
MTKITLRLNPDEHHEFISLLNEMDDFLGSPAGLTKSKPIINKNKQIIKASQVILKEEWDRVKRGEESYVNTKVWISDVACAMFIFGVLTLGFGVMFS